MPHWEALKTAIDKRGLSVLVSEGGTEAAAKMVSELEEGTHIDNFDPLMHAHNAIFSNAVETASQLGLNPLIMLSAGSPEEYQCPICFLNGACAYHDEHCDDPNCPKGITYDWMVNRAADDALEKWKEMKL